jgi:hypothetical protein
MNKVGELITDWESLEVGDRAVFEGYTNGCRVWDYTVGVEYAASIDNTGDIGFIEDCGWTCPDHDFQRFSFRLISKANQEEKGDVAPNKLKLLILGTGRSGKDTLSEYLANKYNMPFKSSSEFMSHLFYPFLKDILGYTSPEECYKDRHSCRALWYELISAYNRKDPTTLARKILEDNNIYCGMRSKVEVEACKRAGLFDLVIWVDASDRIDYKEDESSCDVSKEDADIVITNNGTEQEFYDKIDRLMDVIGVQFESIEDDFEYIDPMFELNG